MSAAQRACFFGLSTLLGAWTTKPEGFELKKWDALKAALEPALAAAQPQMSFGLLLYPFGAEAKIPLDCFEGCCELPADAAAIRVGVEPASSSASEFLAALDATSPAAAHRPPLRSTPRSPTSLDHGVPLHVRALSSGARGRAARVQATAGATLKDRVRQIATLGVSR
jgi:hypothetical protein